MQVTVRIGFRSAAASSILHPGHHNLYLGHPSSTAASSIRFVHHLLLRSPSASVIVNKMKFRSSTLSLLALSVPAATTTAWAPVSSSQVTFRPSVFGGHHHQTALFSAVVGYSTEQVGEAATESFRLKFKAEEGSTISPWHDIPLEDGSGYNMVVEIPKMTKVRIFFCFLREGAWWGEVGRGCSMGCPVVGSDMASVGGMYV